MWKNVQSGPEVWSFVRLCCWCAWAWLWRWTVHAQRMRRLQQEWIGASGGDAIEDFRVERAQIRDRELAELQNIIDSELTQSAERAQAQSRKMDILKWAEQETTMEGVLRARGYEQAVITVHQDSVNVLVKAESLSKHDSAIILELVSRETGQTGGNIKIIPLN